MAQQRTLGLGDIPILQKAQRQALIESGVASSVFNPSALYDAFGRQRNSQPETLFDSKQLADNLPLFYDDTEVSGGGTTSVFSTLRASTMMGVADSTAGVRIRQTFRRFNYQPAKSQLIFCTFVLGTEQSGITKRIGYFDNDNGVFLEQTGDGLFFVVRSSVSGSPVDTRTNILESNINPTLAAEIDPRKSQILFMDLEWLGVGAVAFGFVVDRIPYYVHISFHTNILDSVYMSTPNQPIRYEIRNDGTGGAATLEHICSSVISEGGAQETGVTRFLSRGATTQSINANNVWIPLISIRLKDAYKGTTVLPTNFSVNYAGSAIYEVAFILNPIVASDSPSWQDEPNSAIQVDIARTNAMTLTGGTMIAGTGQEQTNQSSSRPLPVTNLLTIGEKIDGTKDELVLATRKFTGSSTTCYATMNIRELL